MFVIRSVKVCNMVSKVLYEVTEKYVRSFVMRLVKFCNEVTKSL